MRNQTVNQAMFESISNFIKAEMFILKIKKSFQSVLKLMNTK